MPSISTSMHFGSSFCRHEHIWETMIGSGTMMTILSIAIQFPIYIWIILRNMIPKLFTRLGVTSLLIIDVVGHSQDMTNIANHTQCLFQVNVPDTHNATLSDYTVSYPALNMHWAVLIAPTFLLMIGPLMMVTTTFEFISAQSTHSMKVFFLESFLPSEVSFSFSTPSSLFPFPSSIHGPVGRW